MRGFGFSKAEWRPSPWLWTPVAWILAVAWPPVSATLLLFPAATGGALGDWRVKAMVAAALGVGAGLWLIARERRTSGTPYTRVGVVMRFFVLGAVFTAALIVSAAFLLALASAPFADGFGAFFGALKTTLFLFGVAGAPVGLLIGLSYALWAGLVVAAVAFSAKPVPVRLRSTFAAEPESSDLDPEPVPR